MEMYESGELQQLLAARRLMTAAAAPRPRLIVGITGATGAAYGVRLLRRARAIGAETHLILSPAGVLNAHHELGLHATRGARGGLQHAPGDIGACVASGSFSTAAMVVRPVRCARWPRSRTGCRTTS